MTWEEIEPEIDKIEIIYSMDKHSERKIFELVTELESGVYLEIGTAYGRTIFAAASAAKGKDIECYGIDDLSLLTRDGDKRIRGVLEGLPATLIVSKSIDAPWDKPIDILVIDGCHIAEVVKKDYEKFIPFLKSGGYLVIDDWCDTGHDETNAHWGIAYYGKMATEGWEEIEIPWSRAKCFKKP